MKNQTKSKWDVVALASALIASQIDRVTHNIDKKPQNHSFSRRYTQMFADKIKIKGNQKVHFVVFNVLSVSISFHLRLNSVLAIL